MSVSLKVNLLGKEMAGPVVGASGTFGFGEEYAGMVDLKKLGGISGQPGRAPAGDPQRPDQLHRPAEPRCAALHRP